MSLVTATGHKGMAWSWVREGQVGDWNEVLHQRGHWHRLPRAEVTAPSCQCSRSILRHRVWIMSSQSCVETAVGLKDPRESLPTQDTVCSYSSFSKLCATKEEQVKQPEDY